MIIIIIFTVVFFFFCVPRPPVRIVSKNALIRDFAFDFDSSKIVTGPEDNATALEVTIYSYGERKTDDCSRPPSKKRICLKTNIFFFY